MKEINTKNKDLFELLANKSGTPIRNIDDIDDFYATMMVEASYSKFN
jgi:two-component SAPR family response regulator